MNFDNSGLYYKPIMIVNDNLRVVNKLKTSLTDDARVVIYDFHMFIVQATDFRLNLNTPVARTIKLFIAVIVAVM